MNLPHQSDNLRARPGEKHSFGRWCFAGAIPLLAISTLSLFLIFRSPTTGGAESSDAKTGAQTKGPDDTARAATLHKQIELLRPLHKPLGKPGPGDWLAQHKESGQTFDQYIRSQPVRPLGKRKIIYIQPIGTFTKKQRKIVQITAECLGVYFNAPVKIKEDWPLKMVPDKARRVHPTWGDKQILSTHVLDKMLRPKLPEDAACYIAFTSSDLWPGKGWNFVFGQASLRQRVGVWSIYRNGKADGTEAEYLLCLLRTLKTATHETGHMFSMYHCTAYECDMCGSNNRKESDRRDLWLGPICAAKVCWAARVDPVDRYRKLRDFCKKHGLKKEAAFYEKSIKALQGG
jgi:archaemetzincin